LRLKVAHELVVEATAIDVYRVARHSRSGGSGRHSDAKEHDKGSFDVGEGRIVFCDFERYPIPTAAKS
jgi:hypothetical protein